MTTSHVRCIANTGACTARKNSCCPDGFQRFDDAATGAKQCVKKWRAVGYQELETDKFPPSCSADCTDGDLCSQDLANPQTPCSIIHPRLCLTACDMEVGNSFMKLEGKEAFEARF